MEDRYSDDNEVTLVLRNSRLAAQKDTLARNSLYFAALFSENFKDHQQKEFEVNYDISLSTLQTFVNWANNEGEHARVVHSPQYHFDVSDPLEKFLNGSHSELLDLLNLSVVFTAEKLTEDIADMIIRMKLQPDFMLELWPLAEDLELKNLRDVAFANCLDRFQELSLPSLLKLSKKNFFRLVLNANVNSSSDYMLFVLDAWKNNNGVINSLDTRFSEENQRDNPQSEIKVSIQPDLYLRKSADDRKSDADPIEIVTTDLRRAKTVYDTVKPEFMMCTVGRKSDNTLFVWAFNVEKREFDEIAEMTNCQMHTTLVDNGKDIVGRQVIGRAFSIYVIGGEQGLGTGRFNTTLWRYCLFYKKWYIESTLPQPRRHMAVAFLKNKLYLFGGVGRHRLKLSSVDVYDIHTGRWSRAANIPETFTEVPLSCVADGKFVYLKSTVYVYDPMSDVWDLWCLQTDKNSVYIKSLLDLEKQCVPLGSERLNLSSQLSHVHPDIGHCEEPEINQQTWNDPWIVKVGSTKNAPYVEVGYLNENEYGKYQKIPISFSDSCTKLTTLPVDCFEYRLGNFNIIDPKTLYQPISSEIFQHCRE